MFFSREYKKASLLLHHSSHLTSALPRTLRQLTARAWAAGQCRIFCLDFAVGRGQFHLSALVDQEVEGCLLCPRVLTNKPKFERCALTPQGKGSQVFGQGRQSSSPRGAGESPSLTSKTWISSHLTLPLFFPLSEHLLSYWLQIYHMFSL